MSRTMDTTRKRRWQFGLREVLIVIVGLGAELAIIRGFCTYREMTPSGLLSLLTSIVVVYLLGLSNGVSGRRYYERTITAFPTAAVCAMVILSMLSAGVASSYFLPPEQLVEGGVLRQYSSTRHAIFFWRIGVLAGLAQGTAFALVVNCARSRAWWLVVASVPTGFIAGSMAAIFIGICFNAMPRKLLELLAE